MLSGTHSIRSIFSCGAMRRKSAEIRNVSKDYAHLAEEGQDSRWQPDPRQGSRPGVNRFIRKSADIRRLIRRISEEAGLAEGAREAADHSRRRAGFRCLRRNRFT